MMLSSQARMYLTPERPIKRRLTFDDTCVPPAGSTFPLLLSSLLQAKIRTTAHLSLAGEAGKGVVSHAGSDLANETAVKEKRKRDADHNEASLLVLPPPCHCPLKGNTLKLKVDHQYSKNPASQLSLSLCTERILERVIFPRNCGDSEIRGLFRCGGGGNLMPNSMCVFL